MRTTLPERPVRLYSDGEDPCARRLHVSSTDQVGLLFKLCELLAGHGIDISSADIVTEDGIVNNRFELHTSRPTDFADANDWCKELEDFLLRNRASGGATLEGSLASLSKRLSVNPDLLSVVSFREIAVHDGPPTELRYSLELEGINQAGLLTYAALVLYRSGFSVVKATISTFEGHILDTFELSTTSLEAERVLRSYLDVPSILDQKTDVPLPFHATHSDADLQGFMRMWGKLSMSPKGSFSSTPQESRQASFDENDSEASGKVLLRSRVPSSDREEPLSSVGAVTRGWGAAEVEPGGPPDAREVGLGLGGASLAPAAGSGAEPARGPWRGQQSASSSSAKLRQRKSRRMSVHFANGDVYTGNCVLFEGGEKRHGMGTYEYSAGTHETYKQYKGEWREDQKHGYGVLFYRGGGVYVGQWKNNQKHGLGVLLDSAGEDPTAMPSYRYEGLWQDDEPHGLGAEESESSSYYGQFFSGKRQGRGVRMSASKMGVAGTEVLDSSGRVLPLLEALEAEMQLLSPACRAASAPSGKQEGGLAPAPCCRPNGEAAAFVPATSSSAMPPCSGGGGPAENESGSSGKTSGGTRTPMSARVLATYASRPELVATPSENQATPLLGPGNRGVVKLRADSRTPMSMASFPSRGDMLSPSLQANQQTPLLHAGGLAPRRSSKSPPMSPGIHGSSGTASPNEMLPGGLGGAGGGGSVIFSLCEENNLLSPHETTLDQPIPEENARACGSADEADHRPEVDGSLRHVRSATWHGSPRMSWEESLQDCLAKPRAVGSREGRRSGQMQRAPKKTVSDPSAAKVPSVDPAAAAGGTEPAAPAAQARAHCVKEKQPQRPVRSPILWCEEELAAFIVCLGLNKEVCFRIQQKKLKGVVAFLEMSNSEIRRDFGLSTPVERLVIRQSLKRLLDADRWENSVRGHKVGDILGDSVLGKFIVPLEELTLVTKISQGGYGTVYRGVLERAAGGRGRRPHLVAVKEMKGERRVRLYELLKEACVMASLKHPNICAFIGVCADNNARKHYIISELMDCSLFDLIHQPYKLRWHGELSVSLVIGLSKGICAGIIYIHANHLVHADLKSSNILVDYTTSAWHLVPRICDFGHAAVRTFPSPHHRCGTPHWAAPEVLRSEALGPKADIYSFGVIMWEMLTQKLPHKGLSFGQVLASVGWAGWTPDLSLLPDIPPEYRRLLKECLAFSPLERPQGCHVQQRLKRIPKQARLKALQTLVAFLGC